MVVSRLSPFIKTNSSNDKSPHKGEILLTQMYFFVFGVNGITWIQVEHCVFNHMSVTTLINQEAIKRDPLLEAFINLPSGFSNLGFYEASNKTIKVYQKDLAQLLAENLIQVKELWV